MSRVKLTPNSSGGVVLNLPKVVTEELNAIGATHADIVWDGEVVTLKPVRIIETEVPLLGKDDA